MSSKRDPAPWRTYWVEATLAVVLIVGPATWLAAATEADSGNVADWVAAIGTVAAVIVASFAGRWAKEAFQLEAQRSQEAKEREYTAQASQVAAWFHAFRASDDRIMPVRELLHENRIPSKVELNLRNLSSLPVSSARFRVSVVVVEADGRQRRIMKSFDLRPMPSIPPTEENFDPTPIPLGSGNDPFSTTQESLRRAQESLATTIPWLIHSDRRGWLMPKGPAQRGQLRSILDSLQEQSDLLTHVEVTLTFIDSSQQEWTREPSGRLTRGRQFPTG